MTTTTKFATMFSKITKEIPFNTNWNDGGGYFDGAIKGEAAMMLKSGEMAKSLSPNGRHIIFVGTYLGTICVFQRYYDQDDVYVSNIPRALRLTNIVNCIENKLSENDMEFILGEDRITSNSNLGFTIENIYKAVVIAKNTNAINALEIYVS